MLMVVFLWCLRTWESSAVSKPVVVVFVAAALRDLSSFVYPAKRSNSNHRPESRFRPLLSVALKPQFQIDRPFN